IDPFPSRIAEGDHHSGAGRGDRREARIFEYTRARHVPCVRRDENPLASVEASKHLRLRRLVGQADIFLTPCHDRPPPIDPTTLVTRAAAKCLAIRVSRLKESRPIVGSNRRPEGRACRGCGRRGPVHMLPRPAPQPTPTNTPAPAPPPAPL